MASLRRARLAGRLRALPAFLLDPTPGLAPGSAEARVVQADLVWMTVRNARGLVGGFLFLIVLFTVEFFDPSLGAPEWTWRAAVTTLSTQAAAWRLFTSALLVGYLIWDARVRRQRRSERASGERRLAAASMWILLGASALYSAHSLWQGPLLLATMLMYLTVAVLLHPPGRTGLLAYLASAVLSVAVCYALPRVGAPPPDPALQLWSLLPGLSLLSLMLWRVMYVGHVRRLAGRRAFRHVLHDLRQTRRQLARAERAAGEAAERERISRDLHDHVGGRLAAVIAEAEAARFEGGATVALDAVEAGARATMVGLREVVWALHHDRLTVRDLAERLRREVEAQARPRGVAVAVEVAGDADLALGPDAALHLLRLAQEAVSNALRHSGAASVRVRFEADPGGLALTVADDGRFAYPSGEVRASDGFGMRTMAARAEALGGTFALDTEAGTTVRVTVPAAALVDVASPAPLLPRTRH